MQSCSINMNLIDITGICSKDTIAFVNANTVANPPVVGNSYWTQLYFSQTLTKPPQKPDIKELNGITVNVNVLNKRVIVTPDSNSQPNIEGKYLTGRKLIVEAEICLKVVYTACEEDQSVHSVHFYVPFSAYIVIPKTITFPDGEILDSQHVNYLVSPCVEDLFVNQVTLEDIYQNITVLLQATPTLSC